MSTDMIIGLVGIALTIIFGVLGTRYLVNKRKMKQSVSKGSIGIQSGRDTNING